METQQGNIPNPDLDKFRQIIFSHIPARVLAASIQLDLFSPIASGKRTSTEIAKAAGASDRGTRMLLDALVVLELLTKEEGTYDLTPMAARYLVRSSPDYTGSMLETDVLWESWSHLTQAVRTGKPFHKVDSQEKAESYFPSLVRMLHVSNREPARKAAEVLGAGTSSKAMQVLDVGCGSGVWGIAIADADPHSRITAQDFPAMLDVTRRYLKKHNVEKQFDFLPGNLREVDFGKERFDVAILGNIVHSEGERSSRELIRRLYQAIKPGGRVAIIDTIPDEERNGPAHPIFFALNMLLNTEEGDTFTLSEYKQWLTEAGFGEVETADVGMRSPFIIGIKV